MTKKQNNNCSDFLLDEVDCRILILKKKVKSQKKKTCVIHALSIILGALVTLTLGLKLSGFEIYQKNIALVLSAFLTVVTSWNAVFDYKKLWIRQKSTLLDLYQLKNEITYGISKGDIKESDMDKLFEIYKNVWERDGNEWRNTIHKIKNHSSSRE